MSQPTSQNELGKPHEQPKQPISAKRKFRSKAEWAASYFSASVSDKKQLQCKLTLEGAAPIEIEISC